MNLKLTDKFFKFSADNFLSVIPHFFFFKNKYYLY